MQPLPVFLVLKLPFPIPTRAPPGRRKRNRFQPFAHFATLSKPKALPQSCLLPFIVFGLHSGARFARRGFMPRRAKRDALLDNITQFRQ